MTAYVEYIREHDMFMLHRQNTGISLTPEQMKEVLETALYAVATRYEQTRETTL